MQELFVDVYRALSLGKKSIYGTVYIKENSSLIFTLTYSNISVLFGMQIECQDTKVTIWLILLYIKTIFNNLMILY